MAGRRSCSRHPRSTRIWSRRSVRIPCRSRRTRRSRGCGVRTDADVVRALQRACGYVIQKPPREAVGKQLVRFVKRWGRALKRRVTGTLDADVSIGSLLWALLAVGVAVLAVDRSWFGRAKAPVPRADEEDRDADLRPSPRRRCGRTPTPTRRRRGASRRRRGSQALRVEAAAARVAAGPRVAGASRRAVQQHHRRSRGSASARARLRRERERAAAEAVAVVP